MTEDYFDFWSRMPPDAKVHPDDEPVFDRLRGDHSFDLDCLPLNFAGPLKTAPVVLLFLSPGLSVGDVPFAATREGRNHYAEQRTGVATLPIDPSSLGHKWRQSRLKFLGNWQAHPDKIATMNIGAYHSKDFSDHDVLASLPSSRAALNWAQSVLFPEAEVGKRCVICLRAARYWGLRPGNVFGISLFAPRTNRSGHMLDDDIRSRAVRIAQDKMAE